MEQKNKLKLNSGGLLVFILTVGVFGIINTEMGVVGILPLIATTFNVSVPQAGWTVSVFAGFVYLFHDIVYVGRYVLALEEHEDGYEL